VTMRATQRRVRAGRRVETAEACLHLPSQLAVLALASVLLAGCSLSESRIPARPQSSTQLIPREALFAGTSTRTGGRLSPDGRWLTWIAPSEGIANVWIAPVRSPEQARPATAERASPVQDYFWSPDSSLILYVGDNDGDENHRLKAVDLHTRKARVLTSFPGVQTQLVKISPSVPNRILVGLNRRDPKWHDVFALDLRSGKLDLVFQNTGYSVIVADNQLRIRLVGKAQADGSFDYFRAIEGRVETAVLEHVALADSRSTEPLGFASDNRTLYWVDSRGRDTAALIAHDMVTQDKRLIGEHPKADIESALFNPATGVAEGFNLDHLRSEWVTLKAQLDDDFALLRARLPGHISVLTRTRDDSLWLLESDHVSAPASTYLYDRESKRLTKLFSRRPELEAFRLAPMHPISIESRDGLDLVLSDRST
jgi:dipeptidyl aminopeptidase/acylaminoacyl peptidase